MFLQLVSTHPNATPTNAVVDNINSLFTYHPLQISALVETVWLNRYNANPASSQIASPFLPWSPQIAYNILNAPFFPGYIWPHGGGPPSSLLSPGLAAEQTPPGTPVAGFTPPLLQPGVAGTWDGTNANWPPPKMHSTNWDHLIYAYVIENTRIYEIFCKVLFKYMNGGELETPSAASQLFWRNLEFLIFGDAMPSMVWTTSGRLRRDEQANRLATYYWMFGIDLSHAPQVVIQHPYEKPAASNRDFIPTFEAFGREVWRGIVNARNVAGVNDADPTVIATLAQGIYDMMQTQRQFGNLSREEFRAVAIMSYMHLAVLFDSPMVQDLRAEASSPDLRLQKIAERVGMTAHPKSRPLFDLAGPFSILMQAIETGHFNHASGAQALYSQTPPNFVARIAEDVIDQYTLATGRDLKALPVSVVQRATTANLPAPKRQAPPPQLTAPRVNGHARPGQ